MRTAPWEDAKALDSRAVAERLGLEKARQHRKYSCVWCSSSDALHSYPRAGGGFYCHSCGTGGSNVDIAAAVWGIEPWEAAFRLVGQLPPLPRATAAEGRNGAHGRQPDDRRIHSEVYGELVARTELSLQGRRYLKGRGIDPDAAEVYGLRTIDVGDLPMIDRLDRRAGLSVLRRPGVLPVLLLPYWSTTGEVVAIRFRRLDAGGDLPKYLSPRRGGTPVAFNREALAALHDPDLAPAEVIVAEGELDALILHQRGDVAVGLPGATPSRDLREDLVVALEHAPRVILWTDPDEAGDRAAQTLVGDMEAAFGAEWVRRRVKRRRTIADVSDMLSAA